jgi:pilus assembly protein Flp/PilA
MLRQYILLQDMLRTRRDEKGATAVEYGLMVALIAVAIIAAVSLVGDRLNLLFGDVSAELPTA